MFLISYYRIMHCFGLTWMSLQWSEVGSRDLGSQETVLLEYTTTFHFYHVMESNKLVNRGNCKLIMGISIFTRVETDDK